MERYLSLSLILILLVCAVQVSATTLAYYNFEQGTIGSTMQGAAIGDNAGGTYNLSAYAGTAGYAQFGSAAGPAYPYTNLVSMQAESAAGTDGYLSTTASALDLTAMTSAMAGSFTLEAWINPNYPSTGLGSIAALYGGSSSADKTALFGMAAVNPTQYRMYVELSMGGGPSNPGGGIAWMMNNTNLNFGVWHHVALTWNATTNDASIFVDGGIQGTENLPAYWWGSLNVSGNSQFTIGNANGWKFDGKIDEVRLSSGVLSPDQFLLNAIPEPITALSLLVGGLMLRLRRK